jgi:hypothetical protein
VSLSAITYARALKTPRVHAMAGPSRPVQRAPLVGNLYR